MSSRLENNAVYNDLKTREAEWADAGIKSVKLIGDANAPGPIAWATYAVHRYARKLDGEDIGDALPFWCPAVFAHEMARRDGVQALYRQSRDRCGNCVRDL
ncbi:hypothetical protein [Ascidiaceihabitans sp.]|uniref:hypothetical protein n=1 Tax=Ascidiaceihabitans sp. TaxID=1872644 RepID=UPI00329683A0